MIANCAQSSLVSGLVGNVAMDLQANRVHKREVNKRQQKLFDDESAPDRS